MLKAAACKTPEHVYGFSAMSRIVGNEIISTEI